MGRKVRGDGSARFIIVLGQRRITVGVILVSLFDGKHSSFLSFFCEEGIFYDQIIQCEK